MGRQIVQQPDGKYCVFSSSVNLFILEDCTKEQIIEIFAEEAAEEARVHARQVFAKIEHDIPAYYQFTKTYEQVKRLNDVSLGLIADASDDDE